MSYITDFEAELLERLNGPGTEAEIARWAGEKVLESYRNGVKAGQGGAAVARSGQSRRRGFPKARQSRADYQPTREPDDRRDR